MPKAIAIFLLIYQYRARTKTTRLKNDHAIDREVPGQKPSVALTTTAIDAQIVTVKAI